MSNVSGSSAWHGTVSSGSGNDLNTLSRVIDEFSVRNFWNGNKELNWGGFFRLFWLPMYHSKMKALSYFIVLTLVRISINESRHKLVLNSTLSFNQMGVARGQV